MTASIQEWADSLKIEYAVYQIGDGNQDVIEDAYEYDFALERNEAAEIEPAFANECLDQRAVWSAVHPSDRQCLANSHKSNDRIKKERCNLQEVNGNLQRYKFGSAYEEAQKVRVLEASIVAQLKDAPKR